MLLLQRHRNHTKRSKVPGAHIPKWPYYTPPRGSPTAHRLGGGGVRVSGQGARGSRHSPRKSAESRGRDRPGSDTRQKLSPLRGRLRPGQAGPSPPRSVPRARPGPARREVKQRPSSCPALPGKAAELGSAPTVARPGLGGVGGPGGTPPSPAAPGLQRTRAPQPRAGQVAGGRGGSGSQPALTMVTSPPRPTPTPSSNGPDPRPYHVTQRPSLPAPRT